MGRMRINISIDKETQERLKQYANENHIGNGVSGAIEHLVWKAKLKDEED